MLKNLKTITQEEFDKMINEYKKWNKKYLFYSYNYKQLYLNKYNLSNIKIKNKDLRYVIFSGCLLDNVVFKNCNLKNADIRYSKFINTNFVNCDFKNVNVKCSKIINTNFMNCNFSNGKFFDDCKFINSNLSTCNIKNADFDDSAFTNTIMPNYPMTCPEKGSFIGYKKVCDINSYKRYILKLEIPEDARRSSATNNKCRCDKVKVLEIQNLNGSIAKNIIKARSIYNNEFIYKLNKITREPKFNTCRWNECAAGIHFFVNRKDAVNYLL